MTFSSDRLSDEGLFSSGTRKKGSALRTEERRGFRAMAASVLLLRWLVAVWVALTLLLIGWLIADSRPRVNASPNPPPSTWSRSGRTRSWQQFL